MGRLGCAHGRAHVGCVRGVVLGWFFMCTGNFHSASTAYVTIHGKKSRPTTDERPPHHWRARVSCYLLREDRQPQRDGIASSMFNPFLVFSPAAAMVGAQNHYHQRGAMAAQDPISMLVELMDSAEFNIVLYTLFMTFGLIMSIMSCILLCVMQHESEVAVVVWRWMGGAGFLTFLISLVLLVEPRPSHWLPFLESAMSACRKWHPAEIRERLRAWWRWRNKYEAQKRTKLNV